MQSLWLAWTNEADAEGLTDFYGLQRRSVREVFLAGEVFLRIHPRRTADGLSVPLQLQMLPAEMLPLDMNRELPGGGLIRHTILSCRLLIRTYPAAKNLPFNFTVPMPAPPGPAIAQSA